MVTSSCHDMQHEQQIRFSLRLVFQIISPSPLASGLFSHHIGYLVVSRYFLTLLRSL